MLTQTAKILRYEVHNLIRSRWVLLIALFFLLSTDAMFRFGADPSKAVISLMNIVLIVVPLISLSLGIIYFYQSREFVELLLAQPVKRTSIFIGKVTGLATTLSLAFVAGVGIPFLVHAANLAAHWQNLATLLFVGCMFILVFTSMAFWIATRNEDKIRGFGTAILMWLYLSVVYDGLILVAIHLFREYPLERSLIVLTTLNPIDLGRILILLQMDVSVLMGYTGAVFQDFFGSYAGLGLSAGMLLLWVVVPIAFGLRSFQRKDF